VSEAVGALEATRRRLREVEEEVGELRQVLLSLLALLVQKYAERWRRRWGSCGRYSSDYLLYWYKSMHCT
jgi:hypothetical protein